jgi:hypothetical protein
MLKKIIVISLFILIVPVLVFAFFQPATLTNGIQRIAVYTETQAKDLFGRGFWLEGSVPKEGAVTSPDINSRYLCVNGDCTYHMTGTLKDATTTIVSFVNPFGTTATSSMATVEMASLKMTGAATSTYTVACGASATAYAAPTYSILSSDSVATSTLPGLIENGIATAYNGNSIGLGGGSIQKITLTHQYPYFVCKVTTAYGGAFTEASNTFAGKYRVRISQIR